MTSKTPALLSDTMRNLLTFYAAVDAGTLPANAPLPIHPRHLKRTRAALVTRGMIVAKVTTVGGKILTDRGRGFAEAIERGRASARAIIAEIEATTAAAAAEHRAARKTVSPAADRPITVSATVDEPAPAAPTRYSSLAAAAKAWGTARGIIGRSGGYLRAVGFTAYNALPRELQAPLGVHPENVRTAARTFTVWDARTPHGHCVQGWHQLGTILVKIGEIIADTEGRRVRYIPLPGPADCAQCGSPRYNARHLHAAGHAYVAPDEPVTDLDAVLYDPAPGRVLRRSPDGALVGPDAPLAIDVTDAQRQPTTMEILAERAAASTPPVPPVIEPAPKCTTATHNVERLDIPEREIPRCGAPATWRIALRPDVDPDGPGVPDGYACDRHADVARGHAWFEVTPLADVAVRTFTSLEAATADAERHILARWAAEDAAALADRVRAAYSTTGGRDGFLADPGGWIAYLGLTADDDVAAAAIEAIEREGGDPV